jgi:hypothetical protein
MGGGGSVSNGRSGRRIADYALGYGVLGSKSNSVRARVTAAGADSTPRSNRPGATTTSIRSVFLDFMFLTKLNLVGPPGT